MPSILVRTGDTPTSERARFVREPADIVITTPESLYLLLTSNAREAFRSLDTLIIDEIHALVPTKRGAHLALSMERLEALAEGPLQRIGLSATQRPLDEVALYLGGREAQRQPRPPDRARRSPTEASATGASLGSSEGGRASQPDDRPDDAASEIAHEFAGTDGAADGTGAPDHHRRRRPAQGAAAEDRSAGRGHGAARRADRHPERPGLAGPDPPVDLDRDPSAPAGAGAVAHLDADLRQQPPRRRTPRRGAERARRRAARARPPRIAGPPAARRHRGRAEGRPAARPGRDVVARARHRHGRDRSGRADRGAAVGGERPAAHRPRRTPGRRRQRRPDLPEVPRRPGRLRRRGAQHARRPGRGDALSAQSARRAGAADRRHRGDGRLAGRRAVRDGAAGRALRRPRSRRLRGRPRHAGRPLPVRRVRRAAAAHHLGSRAPHGGRHAKAPSAWPSPTAAPSPIAGSTASSSPARRPGPPASASSTRRWCSRARSARPSCSAPRRGASRTSRTTGSSSRRRRASPARCRSGRARPAGRPLEFGRAIGALVRTLQAQPPAAALARLEKEHDLDRQAAENLLQYLADQRAAIGHVPDDRTIVIERCRDELGDWRVCLLSPLGGRVMAPWSMAILAGMREDGGIDVETMWTDDGLVVRFPETDEPPDPRLMLPDPDDVEALVLRQLGATSLFAAQFREAAARALLLPRRRIGGRTPLWQQRKRAADLLAVASKFGSFPMLLETYRECLRDLFDVPALVETLRAIRERRLRVVTVDSTTPSPFAASLLFGYVANYLYDGDAPLAERRAQALSIDHAQLQGAARRRRTARRARSPTRSTTSSTSCSTSRPSAACAPSTASTICCSASAISPPRSIEMRSAIPAARPRRSRRWCGRGGPLRLRRRRRDAARRGRGRQPLPRCARRAAAAGPAGGAARAGPRSAARSGDALRAHARAVHDRRGRAPLRARRGRRREGAAPRGRRRPPARGRVPSRRHAPRVVRARVLGQIRRRSLAKVRHQVEPVEPATLGRLVTPWQGVTRQRRGLDALLDTVETLQGAPLVASMLEREILPARIERLRAGRSRHAARRRRGRVGRRRAARREGRPPRAVPHRRPAAAVASARRPTGSARASRRSSITCRPGRVVLRRAPRGGRRRLPAGHRRRAVGPGLARPHHQRHAAAGARLRRPVWDRSCRAARCRGSAPPAACSGRAGRYRPARKAAGRS